MSKYVDKMNLPQYRFYNHMVGEGEERKELVSDLLTAEMILERGSKKERSQALITLATKKKRLAVWEYRNEWAHSKYVQAQNEAFSEPEQKLSARREKRREKLMEEVRTLSESLKEYGVEPPVGFPYVSEKDMEDWLALWQRFKVK